MKTLIGRKRGVTQIFTDNQELVPVTVIEAGPCFVTALRGLESDGYSAVQLGFEEAHENRLTSAERGHLRKVRLPMLRYLREFRGVDTSELKVGQRIDASAFSPGDRVDVTAASKGRGFAGAIKRHGFHRQRKTHGQSDR